MELGTVRKLGLAVGIVRVCRRVSVLYSWAAARQPSESSIKGGRRPLVPPRLSVSKLGAQARASGPEQCGERERTLELGVRFVRHSFSHERI